MAQAGEIEWVKMKILRRGRIKSAPPEIEIGGRTNEGKNERTLSNAEGRKAGNECICNACGGGGGGAFRGIKEQKGIDQKSPSCSSSFLDGTIDALPPLPSIPSSNTTEPHRTGVRVGAPRPILGPRARWRNPETESDAGKKASQGQGRKEADNDDGGKKNER